MQLANASGQRGGRKYNFAAPPTPPKEKTHSWKDEVGCGGRCYMTLPRSFGLQDAERTRLRARAPAPAAAPPGRLAPPRGPSWRQLPRSLGAAPTALGAGGRRGRGRGQRHGEVAFRALPRLRGAGAAPARPFASSTSSGPSSSGSCGPSSCRSCGPFTSSSLCDFSSSCSCGPSS